MRNKIRKNNIKLICKSDEIDLHQLDVVKSTEQVAATRNTKTNLKTKDRRKAITLILKAILNIITAAGSIAAVVAAVFALKIYNNAGSLNEIRENEKATPNSMKAVEYWKEDLSNIRIGYSRQYIESKIDQPQMIEEIKYKSETYTKCTYVNTYFTLCCVYNQDSSLLGFLIIGNSTSFRFQNYRCGFTLFIYLDRVYQDYNSDENEEDELH